jgi:hypothetical protein
VELQPDMKSMETRKSKDRDSFIINKLLMGDVLLVLLVKKSILEWIKLLLAIA